MGDFEILVPEQNFAKYTKEQLVTIGQIVKELKTENFKQETSKTYHAIKYSDIGAPDELEALFRAMAHGLPIEPMINYIIKHLLSDDLEDL